LPERFPPDTYARLIRLFQEAGKITVLDTSGPALAGGLAAGPSVIKPNRQELEACLGRALRSDHDLAAELRKLSATLELVVVSDGPNGAYFAGRGKILHAGSPPVTVKDTTGSGDSLLGQLCADYFGDGRRELTAAIAARAVAAGAAAAEVRGSPLLARERIQQLAALTHATQL
jgi:1-phosphofructokinase